MAKPSDCLKEQQNDRAKKPRPESSTSQSSTSQNGSSSDSKKRRRSLTKHTSHHRTSPPKRRPKKSRKRYTNVRRLELIIALNEHRKNKKNAEEFEREHGVPYSTAKTFKRSEAQIREQSNTLLIYTPADCTDLCAVTDAGLGKAIKTRMKIKFEEHYENNSEAWEDGKITASENFFFFCKQLKRVKFWYLVCLSKLTVHHF